MDEILLPHFKKWFLIFLCARKTPRSLSGTKIEVAGFLFKVEKKFIAKLVHMCYIDIFSPGEK